MLSVERCKLKFLRLAPKLRTIFCFRLGFASTGGRFPRCFDVEISQTDKLTGLRAGSGKLFAVATEKCVSEAWFRPLQISGLILLFRNKKFFKNKIFLLQNIRTFCYIGATQLKDCIPVDWILETQSCDGRLGKPLILSHLISSYLILSHLLA